MAKDEAWRPFEEVVRAPWDQARQWKQRTGGKVVGHLLPDVPEELSHAAGALPVAVEGAGVSASHAQAHIPSYTCSHAIGALELALSGKMDVLDAMVIPYVCDTTRNLYHIWQLKFPGLANEFLRLPKRMEFDGIRDYLKAEFLRLYEFICGLTGKEPNAEAVTESLKLYNESRAKLRDAYRLHRERPDIWTAERIYLLMASSIRAPREDHLEWMAGLPWDEAGPASEERIPIFVRGKVWNPPAILGLFDELGLVSASDDMVNGFRSVSKDAAVDGDPFEALADLHLSRAPYTGYHLAPDRMAADFVERVQVSGAKGVLFLNPKFCEAAAFDTPDFQKALEEVEIPYLTLETSTMGGAPMEQIRIRLEAFKEMIAGELP